VEKIRPGAGEQLMAIISSFYTWRIVSGAALTNPASHRLLVTGGRRARSRLLTDRDFLALLVAHESEGDPAGAAFLLLALTGCRRREITELRWTEVDLNEATITLPEERRKTGKSNPLPFVIQLHPIAVEAIARQPILEGNPYVFWGRRDKRAFDFQHSLVARIRSSVPVADWRYHDLRRWFRSTLSKLGVPQIVAEKCVNHAGQSQLEQVYNRHSYEDEKAAAWHKLGEYLVELRL
jgi:integrase